jgi:hypothetical protein
MAYDESGVSGPRLVGYNLSSQTYEYMMRLLDVGLLDGPLGHMKPNPRVAPLFDALHHVLAGGSVEVNVTSPGSPDVYNDLNRRAAAGIKEANEINEKSGYYVTINP